MADSNITKDIRGTRTEARIALAYLSESTAYTRYLYYAQQANKEKLPTIAQIFMATANNELHHAKVYFKMMQGGQVTTKGMTIDAGIIGTTEQNLLTAANEEQVEGVEEYIESARIAREEGFDVIAAHFEAIASIEKAHEARFRAYLKRLQDGTLYKRDEPIQWQCLVCGYYYTGTTPPEVCPACDHPQQYYMPVDEEVSAISN